MKNNTEMDQKIEQALEKLRFVSWRDSSAAVRGKLNFLKQAAMIRAAVSRKQEDRHKGWLFPVPQKAYPNIDRVLAVTAISAE
jgi:carbonic anhydrase